jgi:HK97 gp10 family phage protein
MGLDVHISEDGDTLDVFLRGIEIESEELGKSMLKVVGNKAKELVIANLEKHRRVLAVRHKPALADDVKLSIRTDKFGEKYAKVMGGKQTGTLWHIVNDGNLHSRPTHFLDNAMKKIDESIDEAWREAER